MKNAIFSRNTPRSDHLTVGFDMKSKQEDLQLRETGKGFIINNSEGLIGRILTSTYVDQYKRTYVKVHGELTPLTEQHSFLAAD